MIDLSRPFFPDGIISILPLDREYPPEVVAVFGIGDKPKGGFINAGIRSGTRAGGKQAGAGVQDSSRHA
jgi:hypothetical protein